MPNVRIAVRVRQASRIIQNSRWRIRKSHKTEDGLTQEITTKDRHPRRLDAVRSDRVQTRKANVPEMKVVRGITGVKTRSVIVREMTDTVMRKKKGTESWSTEIGTAKESVTQGAKKKGASLRTKAKGADLPLNKYFNVQLILIDKNITLIRLTRIQSFLFSFFFLMNSVIFTLMSCVDNSLIFSNGNSRTTGDSKEY